MSSKPVSLYLPKEKTKKKRAKGHSSVDKVFAQSSRFNPEIYKSDIVVHSSNPSTQKADRGDSR